MFIIRDGWGYSEKTDKNAVYLARTPFTDKIMAEHPHTLLACSGMDVGLPKGLMGNSEVGHLNLGAGRIVYQAIARIDAAIEDGSFFANPELISAIEAARAGNKALHLMGLLSDGGVHSHMNHIFALLELAKKLNLKKVFIHAFLDGRDVPPRCAKTYVEQLENRCSALGIGEIATIGGRYWGMDRDKRWDRVETAYAAITESRGVTAQSAMEAVDQGYARDENDEFIKHTVIMKNGKPTAVIEDGDSVIFFNFRPDRARQMTWALNLDDFSGFERKVRPTLSKFVCMCQYDEAHPEIPVAFGKENLSDLLADVLGKAGLSQLRIAETEKYAHVTYFFNGGEEKSFPGEERILVPSPKVATYDLKPEMSAFEVTDKVLEAIREDRFDLIVLNFANCDMVGHTGFLDAAVKAVETVDTCCSQIHDLFVGEKNGALLISADHGNAEQMWDFVSNCPHTAHTTNPVPFIAINTGAKSLRSGGRLADVAPTILDLLGVKQPEAMTGKSLLE
ncbi:MAG: 2,3-bisphosphoglycerate-independent phosphoglycerate mutase [Candidatus Wallbacteria bacterium]|nr:2,3-bisphosphoglycerate-independent phosphoglycerate mutase [Candidatus Wallbacteria bacterium]